MSVQKRLILCLDGTWNQKDSSTNVLHHFNLVAEGIDPNTGVFQKRYYHAGVGTDPLDSVTGGGFGFGLEKNVRDAYNWLVENYADSDQENADEVYIFGFSRGAYTARSLVGFIGQCGLLRRGAPITVSELWDAYCLLGRNREQHTSVWDKLFKQPKPPIRQISDLATDPWLEATRGPASWIVHDLNPTEKLLIHWSRRIRITYLGVYDTVGAIGWDALAIPGLTSRLAMHNNMRPTTIVRHCRHALAIDENRSSFNHTPFMSYIGLGGPDSESDRNTGENPPPTVQTQDLEAVRSQWERSRISWRQKIEQRWFVGAHSNIGGGYDDNRLAEEPLQWILHGAPLNLCDEPVWDLPPTAADQKPRDSFAEFAQPLWTKILRAKRNYRAIDPDPVPNAGPKVAAKPGDRRPGYTLESINENVDETVFPYWEQSKLPLPPNLYEYSVRRGIVTTAAHPKFSWPGDGWGDFVALIIWATLATVGLASLCQLIGLQISSGWHRWATYIAAFVFPFVDLSESFVNFKQACGFNPPGFRAFLDSIYWTRALGFVLFVCGLGDSLYYLGRFGWHGNAPALGKLLEFYWRLPLLAAAAVILASFYLDYGRFDSRELVQGQQPVQGDVSKGSKSAWLSLFVALAFIFGGVFLVFGLFRLAGALFQVAPQSSDFGQAGKLLPAGLLLVLQCALLYFWRALLWTAEPMAKANLGSIVTLQRCATPGQVRECLDRWHRMLECQWCSENPVTGPAAVRMRDVVGVTLWRDIVGFIPVYSCFLVFGLWFSLYGSDRNLSNLLHLPGNTIAYWWLIPAIAAAANYLEDACLLTYLSLHEKGAQPAWAITAVSRTMSWVKAIGLTVALAATVWGLAAGTLQISQHPDGWRARIGILISIGLVLAAAVYIIGRLVHFFGEPELSSTGSTAAAKGERVHAS